MRLSVKDLSLLAAFGLGGRHLFIPASSFLQRVSKVIIITGPRWIIGRVQFHRPLAISSEALEIITSVTYR